LPNQINEPLLDQHVRLLRELVAQDLEPDPNDPNGSRLRIRDGVATERIVSIEDPQMRHGRKSKSKRFNGYKRHLAADLDTRLILACAVKVPLTARLKAALKAHRHLKSERVFCH
jgi:hypothetical protein